MNREETIKRYLYPTEYFKDNLKYYIQAFAEFYGIENYEYINYRFTNMFPIFVLHHFDLSRHLRQLEDMFGKEYIQENYAEFYKFCDEHKSIIDNCSLKYNKEYIRRIVDYLPERYKASAIAFANSQYESLYQFGIENSSDDWAFSMFINHFEKTGFSYYFSTKSKEKLNDPNVPDSEKNAILKNRIEVYKGLGFDRGNDYSKYQDLDGVVIPYNNADKIEEIREEVIDEHDKELKTKIFPHKYICEDLNKIDFVWDALSFVPVSFRDRFSVIPNFVMKDGNMELYPMMFCSGSIGGIENDESIIHELNHLYEMVMLGIFNGFAFIKCGFDILGFNHEKAKKGKLEAYNNIKNYTLFNEVINELIAWDIFDILKKIKVGIFGKEEADISKSHCPYLNHAYIVREFYEKYKPQILRARKDHDLSYLFDAVGEENFEALNDLINEDCDIINHKQLDKDLSEGKDTDLTRKYNEIIERKNMILEKMDTFFSEKQGVVSK